MSDTGPRPAKDHAEEVKWTDDQVRWVGEESAADRSQTTDDDDEAPMFDPFQDPDPHEVFSFRFPNPYRKPSGGGENEGVIEIELRGYKYESDQIWQSTGLTLWRASERLCEYLVKHSEVLSQGKGRIIELGAGLGLCGILAHRLRSSINGGSSSPSHDEGTSVMLTDGDTDVLPHLRENVERNTNSQFGNIACHQLLWGIDTSNNFLDRQCGGDTFDIILAADIVYAPIIVQPLWETVQTLLSRGTGIFLLAYTQRDLKVSIENVLSAAQEAGFSYEGPKQWDDPKDSTEGIYIFRWKHNAVDGETKALTPAD